MISGAIYSKNCIQRLMGWLTLLVALSAFLLCMWPARCIAATPSPAQEQSTMLVALLQEQEQALTEALTSLEMAQTALEQSTEALDTSASELTSLRQALTEARQELQAQKQETSKLRVLLATQQQELSEASKSIASANALLSQAKADMLAADKGKQRQIKKARAQRTLWQALCVALAGAAVTR